MIEFLGLVGMSYTYVAMMFGRASWKAHNNFGRVLVDALTWPVMGWQVIEDLYHA